jgi:transaldolase
MAEAPASAMKRLLDLKQSVWLDYLHRRLTRSGGLAHLIDDGLRGMTSNPTIFEQAIAGSDDYDDDLAAAPASMTDRDVFERLAITDVREAADRFRSVYDATAGADGFVSLELSPAFSRDTTESVIEARRLWRAVDRPNVMIKIPGTREGWAAIELCLQEGINVNITLLFSAAHYRAVAEGYLCALEARIGRGQPIDRLASVASFFVSRIDTEVDKRIRSMGGALRSFAGTAALASARLAFEAFTEMRQTLRWQRLEQKGARQQRLLWASTGTKDPRYSDVMYVESLIGPDTVVTVPPDTLKKFEDHGRISIALSADVATNHRVVLNALAAGGIDFVDVNRTLENEGIAKFAASSGQLLSVIARKRREGRISN